MIFICGPARLRRIRSKLQGRIVEISHRYRLNNTRNDSIQVKCTCLTSRDIIKGNSHPRKLTTKSISVMSLQGNVFKLTNGVTIPAVAYGVGTKWKSKSADVSEPLVSAIKYALCHGFSHIDGASIYGTDCEIGAALTSVDRGSVFLTNKYTPALKGKGVAHANPFLSLKAQLKDLRTDYVDLYLIHHPFISVETNGYDLKQAWKYMEQIVDTGLAKSIGVSNFSVEDLNVIMESARIKPLVNQIEFNAYLQNQTPGIVKFCQDNNILVEAYGPLAPLFLEKAGSELYRYVEEVGKKYSVTPAQVLLRWALQQGALPVTTSSNESRILQLNDLFRFDLTPKEETRITEIGSNHGSSRKFWKDQYSQFD